MGFSKILDSGYLMHLQLMKRMLTILIPRIYLKVKGKSWLRLEIKKVEMSDAVKTLADYLLFQEETTKKLTIYHLENTS